MTSNTKETPSNRRHHRPKDFSPIIVYMPWTVLILPSTFVLLG